MAGRNLVNFDRVSKAYGERPLLDDVSLGVGEAERIAVVGRNGAGKSTLLALMAGLVSPDSGRVTVNSGVHVGAVSQAEGFDPQMTVAEYVVPGQDVHQWASDPAIREIFDGLLGGFDEDLLARRLGTMSGGERRRVQLARALIADLDLLLLDEPTNHLDVEVVAWLADHLASRPRLSVVKAHRTLAGGRRFWNDSRSQGGAVDAGRGQCNATSLARASACRGCCEGAGSSRKPGL